MPDAAAPRAPFATGWRGRGLAAIGGGVAALGLAPFDLWPLALLALGGVLWTLDYAATRRDAALLAWFAGVGYFAVALHWIVEPFLVDIARHGWMAPFALVFMAGGLALFWAGAAALASWIVPRGPLRLPALVAALTLAEILRSVVFTGFPWASLGHVLISSPLVHLAAWTGPDGLTLLVLAVGAALARVPVRPLVAGGAVTVVLAGLILTAPVFATRVPPTPDDAPVLRVMQPNAPQHQKWDPRFMRVFLDRMLAFSAEGPPPDVTIWPETSVPAFLETADTLLEVIAGQANGAVSVIGIERREEGRFYNSLAVVSPDGTTRDVYDKHHLVPFGEYLPLGDVLAAVGLRPLVDRFGGFASGRGSRLVEIGPAGTALPLICYEAIFPREVRATAERPDLLLQITNDAWFGTFSGPDQHLAQARLRAIELGVPMIRAANTGISAAIAADGTLLEAIPLGQAGFFDIARPPAASPTLYARIGGWPVTLIVLAVLGAGMLDRRKRLRPQGH